ncbi:hypothetical protein PS623_00392 [Pseudomonas fluorescens]|uniref:hypothetical protein n=1 Tax=Pseudomonas fluorescens TaxID=294 RepID=UPI0012421B21|nr:hypothetical protein [Pseudomonas fluorescens]VVM43806.1 hypothetical protein PS623_00392 [Pseudomonas fluorescens]
MDINFPPTVFIALGVVTAALLTGFFSYMNMVSSKENKVSEFRLSWLDGLRNEIAEYTSAVQELVRIQSRFTSGDFHSEKEKHALYIDWYKETREAFARAVENLSRIQLRLNPLHIQDKPDSPEAKLLSALKDAREASKDGDFERALELCNDIRVAAAPILKSTWDLVKDGEPGYRKTRKYAALTVAGGFYLILAVGLAMALTKILSSQQSKQAMIVVPITETSPTSTIKSPQVLPAEPAEPVEKPKKEGSEVQAPN